MTRLLSLVAALVFLGLLAPVHASGPYLEVAVAEGSDLKVDGSVTFAASLTGASGPGTITVYITGRDGFGCDSYEHSPSTSTLGNGTFPIGPFTPNEAGTFYYTAVYDEDSGAQSSTECVSFDIGKATASVVITDLEQTYDGSNKGVTVTTTPEGLFYYVTYNSDYAAPTDAGSYFVDVYIDDPNYEGSASEMLLINKRLQTITFGDIADPTYGDPSFQLVAALDSELSPSFNILAGPGTITDDYFNIDGTGSITIAAYHDGDQNHEPAYADQIFEVLKRSTMTGVASSPNPSSPGATVTFTATVTAFTVTGTGTERSARFVDYPQSPAGYVQFKVNGFDHESLAEVNPFLGTATVNWVAPGLGTYSVEAYYLGDSNHADSTGSSTQDIDTNLRLWREVNFGNRDNTGDGSDANDFDHDGLMNVFEFATGGDPRSYTAMPGSLSITPLVPGPGTRLQFNYSQAHAAVADGFTFVVQFRSLLDDGEWAADNVTEVSGDYDDVDTDWSATVGAQDEGFLRLLVLPPAETTN